MVIIEATPNTALGNTIVNGRPYRSNFLKSWSITDGGTSPDGEWYNRYGGGNPIRTTLYDGKRVVMLQPKPPDMNNTSTTTRASCLVLRKMLQDFDATVYMMTISQTKGRAKGENWEVAWLFFRQSDRSHHYSLLIQKNGGVELGRKDWGDQWQEKQIFLKTTNNTDPRFAFFKWYKVRLRVEGFHIQVWVDNILRIDVIDDGTFGREGSEGPLPKPPSDKLRKGFLCLYTEDAKSVYRDIVVDDLNL